MAKTHGMETKMVGIETKMAGMEAEIATLRSQRSLPASSTTAADRQWNTAFDRKPESCQDLLQIGYYLNGFYSVKGGNGMKTVYCDFMKAFANVTGMLYLNM